MPCKANKPTLRVALTIGSEDPSHRAQDRLPLVG